MKKYLAIVTLLYFNSFNLISQYENELSRLIHRIEMERYGIDSVAGSSRIYQIDLKKIPPSVFYNEMLKYKNDSSIQVRELMFSAVTEYGLKNSNLIARRKAVFYLLNSYNDVAVSVESNNLEKFSKSDFDQDSRKIISELICCKKNYFYKKKLYLLAGYIEIHDTKNDLKKILYEGKNISESEKKSLHMSLARLGVKSEIDSCISIVESYPVFNKVYDGFKMLSYIKQPEVLNYFLHQFKYNKQQVDYDPNFPEKKLKVENIALKYYMMMVENFPIIVYHNQPFYRKEKRKLTGTETIEISKKWIKENTKSIIIEKESFFAESFETWPIE